MDLDWSDEKDEWLKVNRNIGFGDVMRALQDGGLLDRRAHHNQDKYPNQEELIIKIDGYVYIVPCVKTKSGYFCKTIIPSRREYKKYIKGEI